MWDQWFSEDVLWDNENVRRTFQMFPDCVRKGHFKPRPATGSESVAVLQGNELAVV